MRILMFPLAALLLLAPFARAADVTGKWRGTAELKTPDGEALAGGAKIIGKVMLARVK